MVIKLYGTEICPCVRSCLLLTRTLNIDVEFVSLDVLKGEHHAEEFKKINPQHVVPTLIDNDVVLWDSHVIMMYLAEKYGNDSPLYPKDLIKRAIINRFLFLESSELFPAHKVVCCHILYDGNTEIPDGAPKLLHKALGTFENLIKGVKYVTGDQLTIADFSLWATVSTIAGYLTFDPKIYPNLLAWIKLMESLPYADLNTVGAKQFKDRINKCLGI